MAQSSITNTKTTPRALIEYFIIWQEDGELKNDTLQVLEHEEIQKEAEDFVFQKWLEDNKSAPTYSIINPHANLRGWGIVPGLAAKDEIIHDAKDEAGHFVLIRDQFIAGHLKGKTAYFYGLLNKKGEKVRAELVDISEPENAVAFHEWINLYKEELAAK